MAELPTSPLPSAPQPLSQATDPPRRCPLCGTTTAEVRCPIEGMATLLRSPPRVDLGALQAGTLLGARYRIKAEIGRGGFGAVFRCQHIGTGQDVAVKVLALPSGDHDIVLQRFFLEARATAGLTHPNTLRVFDFGQDDSGAVFLVMELLEGHTLADALRDRVRRGQVFGEREAATIGEAIARSLAEAHDKGLVHRDLKPHNVFLHRVPGDDPMVKVLDFGIAHSAELASHEALTQTGQVLGTPAYMSPEQAQSHPVDGRSDLYSLGILLYELVTGATPFAGQTPVSVLFLHVSQPVPPVRDRARTPLSDAFVAILERALAKDPAARFPDASQMRQALRDLLGRGAATVVTVTEGPVMPAESDATWDALPKPDRQEHADTLADTRPQGTHPPAQPPADVQPPVPVQPPPQGQPQPAVVTAPEAPPQPDTPRARWPLLVVGMLAILVLAWWFRPQRPEPQPGPAGAPVARPVSIPAQPVEVPAQPVAPLAPTLGIPTPGAARPVALPMPPAAAPTPATTAAPPPVKTPAPHKPHPRGHACDPFDPYCR